jgi:hypothetical protein
MRPERRFSSAGMAAGGRPCGRPNKRTTTPSDPSLFKPKNGLDNGGHFRVRRNRNQSLLVIIEPRRPNRRIEALFYRLDKTMASHACSGLARKNPVGERHSDAQRSGQTRDRTRRPHLGKIEMQADRDNTSPIWLRALSVGKLAGETIAHTNPARAIRRATARATTPR